MQEVVRLQAELASARAELCGARAELTGAKLLIEQLKGQLAVLQRMEFGRSSEKLTGEILQLELLLEDVEERDVERTAPAATVTGSANHRRHPSRRLLPNHLLRKDAVHRPGDACPCCGGARLSEFGEDVTEVLEHIPAKLKGIRHIRPRLSCRSCETVI
ncbi:IS66 family transposase zinc-finger binding domain-containing protein [Sandaracinobacteroides saxicola]|uniref:IS66 family transposase zinc-finger binding domain-containing protein n=1 Tax=Sandaracinobacteroides saxicola TaxID=2759707 RepID=UPI0037D9C1EB